MLCYILHIICVVCSARKPISALISNSVFFFFLVFSVCILYVIQTVLYETHMVGTPKIKLIKHMCVNMTLFDRASII